MVKQLWLALGLGLAVFIGVAVSLAGPGATWAQAAPEQLSTTGIAGGLTAALLVLFITVFLGLAVIDGVDMRRARRRIDALVARLRDGKTLEPEGFIAAMGRGVLGDSAKTYAFTLRPEPFDPEPLRPDDRGTPRYVGADPSDVFTADALIDDRLYVTAFRRLPTILILISAVSLAFGLRGLLVDYGHGAALSALAADGQAVLVGCALPLFAAVVVGVIVPVVVAMRRRQLAGLIGRVGLLFHGTDEQFYVRRLLEMHSSDAADLRHSLATVLSEVKRLFESLRRRVEDQAMPSGAGLPAIEHAPLDVTRDVIGGVTRAELAQKLDRMVERLDQVATALGAAAARPAETGEGTAGAWGGAAMVGDRLEQLGGVLAVQAAESVGAIKQLQATVESLGLSVAPVLNRFADTQEALLAALSGENTTSRLLADVADDLRQLSRTNRETLERHLQLATELAKVGQMLEGMAAGVQPRPQPQPSGKVSDGLMRAFNDLRAETADAASKLPSLDHVA